LYGKGPDCEYAKRYISVVICDIRWSILCHNVKVCPVAVALLVSDPNNNKKREKIVKEPSYYYSCIVFGLIKFLDS